MLAAVAMTTRAGRRNRERRLAGLLVTLLCVLWPLASWHELTTRHEVCPEHGERLDVAHGAPADTGDGPRVDGQEEEDGHEECAFSPLAQPADGQRHAVVPEGLALAGLVPTVRVEVPRAPTFPRYLLAPKQSPPSGRAS